MRHEHTTPQTTRAAARCALLLAILAAPGLLLAQQPGIAPPGAPPPADAPDIIVEGLVPSAGKPLTEVERSGSRMQSLTNLQRYEKAEIYARCARKASPELLHKIIDGPPGEAGTIAAQERLLRGHVACQVEKSFLIPKSIAPKNGLESSNMSDLGEAIYDRGALLEQVLRTYAPDLVLTRQQTSDPTVHARFNAREIPLNRWRNSDDRRYFEVALCMVRLQPELSVRLVRSELGSSQQSMLQRAVIERARACIGDARRVRVDPTQFRIYIGDAVYRWTVAAQGVESLIPLGRD